MQCPSCGGSMSEIAYEGVLIDRCGACGGTWLDHKEIVPILRPRLQRMEKFEEFRKELTAVNVSA